MPDSDAIPLVVRLVCSFIAAFPAAALLSRSRDASLILMILGAVFLFVDGLYALLAALGMASYELARLPGIPLLQSILAGLPVLFFAAGFIAFIVRNRRY